MKKSLFLFISLCLLYGVTLSQNIENKLGAGGTFSIKDTDDKNLFLFTKDVVGEPDLIIGKDPYGWASSERIWMIDVQSTQIGALISFANFQNGDHGAHVHFQKAHGLTGQTPGEIQAGDKLGSLIFTGYKSDKDFNTAAEIRTTVTNTGTESPAAKISFFTSEGGTTLFERMVINDDGAVHINKSVKIDDVLKLTPRTVPSSAEEGDIYYDSIL